MARGTLRSRLPCPILARHRADGDGGVRRQHVGVLGRANGDGCDRRSFVVINTNDSGAGSLRQAIIDSNATPGVTDTISFNIPGGGVHTITPTIALPAILSPAIIDATTQPGYSGAPLIELNGSGHRGGRNERADRDWRQHDDSRSGDQSLHRQWHFHKHWRRQRHRSQLPGHERRGHAGECQRRQRRIRSTGRVANRIGGLTAAQRNVISGNAIDGIAIHRRRFDREPDPGQLHRHQRRRHRRDSRTDSTASPSSDAPSNVDWRSCGRRGQRAVRQPVERRWHFRGQVRPATRSKATSSD